MSNEKYFVIGIGGTGMRCIEAFTHLCAVGMFDDKEIDILSIDTDTNNGNKGRSEQLIDRYARIKGNANAVPTSQSFFTAKLNLYKYAPQYSGDTLTYARLSGLATGSEDARRRNRDLSDLLFDADVQEFKLDHGYRAQTHLGSHLIYHAILEAAQNVRDGRARKEEEALMAFINRIYDARDDARVFILGSIFGGTGASAIPILPKALDDALRVRDKNLKLSEKAKFACSLLTDYFTFNAPDGPQKAEQKIIADSNNFARNSQAALMFYEADSTVRQTYDRLYHVGWPSRVDYSGGAADGLTVTGGGEQKNPAHVTELLCAAAAHHFFQGQHDGESAEFVYRSASMGAGAVEFEFQDFVGAEFAATFKSRLGSMLALSHIVTSIDQGSINSVRRFEEFGSADYKTLTADDARDLDAYFQAFAYAYEDDKVIPGWLFQIHRSVGGPFLFNTDAFSANPRQLRGFHFGKLFNDEAHQFARKGRFGLGEGNPYEKFSETILNDAGVKPDVSRQKVQRLNERFLAHCFNALTKLYNFR